MDGNYMDEQQRYLENLVKTASPARLRLLLIERAIEVADWLANTASTLDHAAGANDHAAGANDHAAGANDHAAGANKALRGFGKSPQMIRDEQTLRLRDLLGELLEGVTEKEWEVAKQVSDLYVFLIQAVGKAEVASDPQSWRQIAEILRIEQGTWAEVCTAQSRRPQAAASGPPAPNFSLAADASPAASSGSLNLQG